MLAAKISGEVDISVELNQLEKDTVGFRLRYTVIN